MEVSKIRNNFNKILLVKQFFLEKALPCELNSPCKNGANCQDSINGYKCSCVNGYRGTNCEIRIIKTINQLKQHHKIQIRHQVICFDNSGLSILIFNGN